MNKPMSLNILRKQDQAVILNQGWIADTYWTRLRGLIGKKSLNAGEGVLFPRCNNIHMWMMSMPIDVVFLKNLTPSREWSVLSVHSDLKPWKLMPVGNLKADDVLELPCGTISKLNLQPGEVLCIAS